MKHVNFILIILFAILIFNSSFSCFIPLIKVSVDSIQYFKPNKIMLYPDDLNESTIQLNLKDGWHTFYKDSTEKFHPFKSVKDEKNFYIIEWIAGIMIKDSFLLTNIQYQAFDKKWQLNSSKPYKLKEVPIPIKNINSFRIPFAIYNKELRKLKN